MRADFYHLELSPAEAVTAMLAARVLAQGGRLVVAAGDEGLATRISDALWRHGGTGESATFLAHGRDGEGHESRQPVLIAPALPGKAPNAAEFCLLADSGWCAEARGYARAFLLFDAQGIAAARSAWRLLGEDTGIERRYWRQDGRRWREGP